MKKKHRRVVILSIVLLLLLALLILCIKSSNKTNMPELSNHSLQSNYTNIIASNEYDISSQIVQTPNPPKISAGMIPIKKVNNNWYITTTDDPNWYDYSNR